MTSNRLNVDVPDLRRITLELLTQVPQGKVTTYRALALALGDSIASRAVGEIVASNEHLERYPCYKVVHSDGRVGRYSAPGGSAAKTRKLEGEGVPVRDGRVEDLVRHVFHRFETDQPLVKLRALQEELADRVVQRRLHGEIRTVGGVDLSYRGPWRGVGAYVLLDFGSRSVRATETAEREIHFPYIPTYLAFRELPVLLELLRGVRESGQLPDVLMVDGSGVLHHRHVGIASHLGVLLEVPTVGVTKTLLYGEVERDDMAEGEARPVVDPASGQRIGAAVRTRKQAHPIYVSVGHGVHLDEAVAMTLALSAKKLPEPIDRAHRVSKEAAHPPDGAKSKGQRALDL